MGMWNNYKEELDQAKLELAESRVVIKMLKKRAKKAEKALKLHGGPVAVDPNRPKPDNVFQKLAESIDSGAGLAPAKLSSWRAARTAEYLSQKNAMNMGQFTPVVD